MSDFAKWLKTNTGLSDSSIYKYSHAADTVMEEMLALGVISKPFCEMTEIEIDIAIAVIIHDQHFIKKNTKGNAMYSNALKQYRAFSGTKLLLIRMILKQHSKMKAFLKQSGKN